MIQVIVKKQNGNITGFHMEGHASEGMDEERGMISFDLTGEISEKTQLLLQSMLLGIEHIAEEYGKKYVQIINR